ncbi:phage gp6-like head-tail connector protein [Paenibacillus larvae]|nr:phage gp6-like head-tail connector protein [Paenibacillus larvae]MDT2261688.1 phage gp6-like head-tail connector protein [Paenibacillus larvae]
MGNISLEEVKEYLQTMMMPGSNAKYAPGVSKEYLANAGVKESNNYLYKLAVMVWVSIYYGNG